MAPPTAAPRSQTRFAERDPRFRIVSQDNGGLSKARNTGVDAATGEFLAFVDSDDLLPPHAYELLYGALAKTSSDFATGNFYRITLSGTQKPRSCPEGVRAHAARDPHHAVLATAGRPHRVEQAVASRVLGCERVPLPRGRVNEDIWVTLPAHFKAQSVDVIAKPVYYYRARAGETLSITQRGSSPST